MPRFSKALFVLTPLYLVPLFFTPASAQELNSLSGEFDALEAMNKIEAERLEEGREQTLVAPYFDLRRNHSARIVLANRFSQPLTIEITAFDLDGDSQLLAVETLLPRGRIEVALAETLGKDGVRMNQGSVHVEYFGDDDMVQGWLILDSQDGGVVEFPLMSLDDASHSWFSFWDLRTLPTAKGVHPRYFVHNPGRSPVRIRVQPDSRPSESSGRSALEVRPRGLTEIHWPAGTPVGLLEIDAEGDGVLVLGLLEGPRYFAQLPTLTSSMLKGADAYESPLLPFPLVLDGQQSDALRSIHLQAYNADSVTKRDISLQILSPSGQRLAEEDLSLPAGGVRSVFWQPNALGMNQLSTSTGVRLRVSNASEVSVFAQAVSQEGDIVDVAFFPNHQAHSSGTYPLPEVPANDVWITWANLGDTSAKIVGQLSWEGGTYALGPFTIPAGASRALTFTNLQSQGKPDLLGRILPETLEQGFFQWTVRSGSRTLIARTEVRAPSRLDSYGMNCVSCCSEAPWGDLIPGSVAFDLGQTPNFQAVENISSCSGVMGPFPVIPNSMTITSPLSWNGSTISTTDFTRQTVGFAAQREAIGFDCRVHQVSIFDEGPVTVDTCMDEHGPEGYDESGAAGGCPQQTPNCGACYICCEQLQKVGKCRCKFGGNTCLALAHQACRSCKTACAEKHDITGCPDLQFNCPA